jgi:hypothetical protein
MGIMEISTHQVYKVYRKRGVATFVIIYHEDLGYGAPRMNARNSFRMRNCYYKLRVLSFWGLRKNPIFIKGLLLGEPLASWSKLEPSGNLTLCYGK